MHTRKNPHRSTRRAPIPALVLHLLLVLLPALASAADPPCTLELHLFAAPAAHRQALAVLTLTPAPGWHAYGPIQGPSGFPTTLTANVDDQPVDTLYPPPTPGPDPMDPTLTVQLYAGPTPLFIPLDHLQDGTLHLKLDALLCSATTCQPVRETRTLFLNATAATTLPSAQTQTWWPVFQHAAKADAPRAADQDVTPEPGPPVAQPLQPRYFAPELEVHTLGKAAALAFLAGLILNFMPCVLPVITLKLRSFIPVADSVPQHQRHAFQLHNLFFALGILLYFLVLAVAIAITGMAWGQIFQQPAAIITLTAIVFALALSLFGVYDLPFIDLKGRSTGIRHHPQLESFTTGILATLLATPCSGPFLGGVLAWALLQPPTIIATVMICIGLGMSSPYLAMAALPSLYRLLPRPGAWTTQLERFLGFLLAGTCVYLMGLLPATLYLSTLILLWAIAAAAWIWGQWTSLNHSRGRRWSIRGAALLAVTLTVLTVFHTESAPDPWERFDSAIFRANLGRQAMILDFTADWCPNCKFLEKTVLNAGPMSQVAREYNVRLFKVDLTRHDPELMQLLHDLGAQSIPVLAIFPVSRPDSPLVLRDLFTSAQLQEALEAELHP